jgi:hypothetical protein
MAVPEAAEPGESETAASGADPIAPDLIMQLGMSFWGSKALLSAIEVGLFSELAEGPLTLEELTERLGLHDRSAHDFFDALVALGMLERSDDGYANTAATDVFLDRAKPSYVGGILEMANARLYGFWGSLTEALKTGKVQNEAKGGGESPFVAVYADPAGLRRFLAAMSAISLGSAIAIADKFPWDRHRTFCDLGTAEGTVPAQIALRHPHLIGGGFDLPPVAPIFEERIAAHGLSDRVKFTGGDFFVDPLPPAEVYVMGHILHDWGIDNKRVLLKRAYDALPEGGALIVYDAVIDDDRRTNAFGLLMSLNMLIETHEGFDYTGADCCSWMTDAGFTAAYVEHLVGPDSMVVALK